MKKGRIGIVSLGYAWFPCEPGPSRFFYIAKIFAENGYDVDVIGSDFQHFKKCPRERKVIKKQKYPFNLTFISVPSYKKNVDVRRIYSNKIAAKRVVQYLETQEYDVIYCSIPSNNIAAKVGAFCKKNAIPYIVDVEDLWPEAMEMIFNIPFIKNILFYPFKRDAERAYRNADAIIGTSTDYTDRAFKKRKRNIPCETVYVGCELENFDFGVRKYKNEIIKNSGEFWVTYAGSISTCYDIKTLIEAGYSLRHKGVHIQILGTGTTKSKLEEYSKNMDNIHFWGFTQYHQMAAVLSKSDIVINSFVKGAKQSIVNKVGDYLASGKPMINTLENPIFCNIINENDIGINIEPENVEVLSDCIEMYIRNVGKKQKQGENARKLAEKEFDRKVSYRKIISIVEKTIGMRKENE